MYDRLSLKKLLHEQGFEKIMVVSASESQIPSFADYGLDTVNGVIRKPDSLFMECRKP